MNRPETLAVSTRTPPDGITKPDGSQSVTSSTPESTPPRNEMITQRELGHYLGLIEASREHDDLRDNIVERLENGALIEPGELQPFVSRDLRQWCNWTILEEVVGREETIRIRNLARDTPTSRLCVSNSQGNTVSRGRTTHCGPIDSKASNVVRQ